MPEPSTISALTFIGGFAVLMYGVLRQAEQPHRQRLDDLRLMMEHLRAHGEALAALIDNPDAPDALKSLAADISEALHDHASVARLTGWLSAEGNVAGSASPAAPTAVLEDVRRTRPDLASRFERCVASGFVAAVLRWPDTAATWRTVAARFAATPDREQMLVRRLRRTGDVAADAPAFA